MTILVGIAATFVIGCLVGYHYRDRRPTQGSAIEYYREKSTGQMWRFDQVTFGTGQLDGHKLFVITPSYEPRPNFSRDSLAIAELDFRGRFEHIPNYLKNEAEALLVK